MKFLVTGASGFIGKRFLNRLKSEYGKKNVFGTYFSKKCKGLEFLDITDKKGTFSFIKEKQPDWIIHCAALPGVNLCEIERKRAKLLNFTGTKNIADDCKSLGINLLFISTNYIFDGKKGHYTEEDKPNPLNYYGKLKLDSENYIIKKVRHYLILRTTNVFGYDTDSKNFVMATLSSFKKKQAVLVAKDQYGNPTYVDDLVKMGVELIKSGKKGIYNSAGPDNLSRLQFAKLIAKVFGYNKNLVVGKTTEELKETALRPKKAGFNISKIKKEISFEPMTSLQGLKYMKKEMNLRKV